MANGSLKENMIKGSKKDGETCMNENGMMETLHLGNPRNNKRILLVICLVCGNFY